MARLRLTLHDVVCFENTTATESKKAALSVSTEKETAEAFFQVGTNKYGYKLTLVDFNFKKKMYQPTEVTADIQISMTSGTLQVIDKSSLVSLFMNKKVSLVEMPSLDATNQNPLQTIGNDYYVQEVKPRYKKDAFYMTLKIYSVDNLLKLHHYSRSFVAKKLVTDILDGELKGEDTDKKTTDGKVIKKYKYPLPYDQNNSITLKYDGAKQLFYKENMEHIFPYLVQYNESFYDFLARTTNRWGEFMYYEDNKLNIGYNHTVGEEKSIGDDYTITYVDLDNESMSVPDGQMFDFAGSEEKGFLDSTLRKSPNSVSGTLFCPNGKGDKVAMKELAALFKNEKNIPTYLTNRVLDNLLDWGLKEADNYSSNRDFDKDYFPDSNKPGLDEQYGEYDFGKDGKEDKAQGYNLFSEINSTFKSGTYEGILKKEYAAAKDAICIDFDTTCPKLMLGDVITVHNKNFIVVEITSQTEKGLDCKVEDFVRVVKMPTQSLRFKVLAIVQNNDTRFYPTVIPAGHVRQCAPQIGTITDAGDPSGKNRVRVMFESWQKIGYEDPEKKKGITDDTKTASSPWITFAASSAGSPTIGKHYEGDKVLIGFIDGNIERPYVMAGLSSKGEDIDYIQTTPGGHKFKMGDDEEGIKNFLTGMFLPGTDTLSPLLSLIPGFNDLKNAVLAPSQADKNNISLGGGFEISDNYGIYKIAGSTDGREIAIASPWGDVNINAFTGITISAPNGDVCIKGKNVSIEAGNNLEITSGTNVKYKLLGETIDKSAGDIASGFFGNIAGAVSKKITQKLITQVDLSMIRNVLDIFWRPAEGAMRIKSNRYLMLESGKGECDYPEAAYKDQAAVQAVMKAKAKTDLRPGLKLASTVAEMVGKVQTLGNKIDSDYRAAYNKCVDLCKSYRETYAEYIIWSDDYDSTKLALENNKICNLYPELKEKLWKAEPAITEADLGFKDNYKFEPDDIKPKALDNYKARVGDRTWVIMLEGTRKNNIIKARKECKKKLLDIAIQLQKAIAAVQKPSALSKKDIEAQIGRWEGLNIPEDFKKALVAAFNKDDLGDTFYYQPIKDDKKDLTIKYGEDALQSQRKALKRKASIILLQKMGFKDEWRKSLVNPAVPAAPAGLPGVPLPIGVPVPPNVPSTRDVPLKTNEADLTDVYWTDYVKTLCAVPQLNAVQWKVFTEAKKVASEVVDNLVIWKNIKENLSWGNAKNGAILFSSDENVYSLKNNTIEEVTVPAKENLMDDEPGVNSFLDKVKSKLNSLN